MHNFEFVKPSTVAEAVKALGREDAQALAGGHTLLPTMKQRLAAPAVLVSLTGIADLRGIRREGDALVIGAATTHAEVAKAAAKDYPALAKLACGIGDPAVRNRGTIGGSLANNDPAADYPAAVLALGATVKTNKRTISADEFFKGLFTTALQDGEIITAVSFPVAAKAGYAKFPHPASRFALTGVFVAKTAGGDVRVTATGASQNGVMRVPGIEAALKANWSAGAIDGVKVPADGLLNDIHGSSGYRANLIKVMAQRAVAAVG